MVSDQPLQVVTRFIDNAYAASDGPERISREQWTERLLNAFRGCTDADWNLAHRYLKEQPAPTDLDVTEYLWYPARAAAASIDGNVDPALKARAVGFVTAIPWPEYSGDGTWSEVSEGLREEFSVVDSQIAAKRPMAVSDMSFLSELGRAYGVSVHNHYPWADEVLSCLAPDPFRPLRMNLPAPGGVLTSMTVVTLLLIEDPEIADTANRMLTEAGVVINPRVFDLYFNDAAVVLPWWRELQPWSGVVTRWREAGAWIGADECGEAILAQLRRSLDWSLYGNEKAVSLLRQDEPRFDSLLAHMEESIL